MTAAMNHPLVSGYLARLAAAAQGLPPDQRAELLADIEGHLRDAMAHGEASEADIRTAVERLGPPEELVAEARGEAGRSRSAAAGADALPALGAGPAQPPRTTKEVAALVLFAIGAALTATLVAAPLAFFLWAPAVVLLLLSTIWSPREKLLGGLVLGVAGSPLLWLLAGLGSFLAVSPEVCASAATTAPAGQSADSVVDGTTVCTGGPAPWMPWLGGAVLLAVVVAWVVVWVRLWRSARRASPR